MDDVGVDQGPQLCVHAMSAYGALSQLYARCPKCGETDLRVNALGHFLEACMACGFAPEAQQESKGGIAMRIGVRAHDFGRQDAPSLARDIKRAGFDTVQLAPIKAILGIDLFEDLSAQALMEVRRAFDGEGVAVDVMGCYIEPAIEDERQRLSGVQQFERCLQLVNHLGARVVATETTRYSGDDAGREKQYQRLLHSVRRMADTAHREGALVGIEPVAAHTLNTARMARRLLDDVRSDALRIVFDPVNLLTPQNLGRQDELFSDFFDLLGDRIAAVHIKDVDENLQEVPIGTGIVRYDAIFKRLPKHLPLLREGAHPQTAHRDIAAIKGFVQGGA